MHEAIDHEQAVQPGTTVDTLILRDPESLPVAGRSVVDSSVADASVTDSFVLHLFPCVTAPKGTAVQATRRDVAFVAHVLCFHVSPCFSICFHLFPFVSICFLLRVHITMAQANAFFFLSDHISEHTSGAAETATL